jgi:hypothetical protein
VSEGGVHLVMNGTRGHATIVIDADFDIACAPTARRLVDRVVQAQVQTLVIDFWHSAFADCTAVHCRWMHSGDSTRTVDESS